MSGICRWMLAGVCAAAMMSRAEAAVLQEDFTNDPVASGWRVFGNTNLFQWNGSQGTLAVTWDSSTSNSYYYHALGTVLAREDDFGLEFDLRLQDIRTGSKSGPFEIAVGFINAAEATRNGFWRGSGVDPVHGARSIVEFDYFPAGYFPDYGPVAASVSPTVVSTNNSFAAQFPLLELTNGALVHVRLEYTGTNGTLRTTLSSDGIPLGPIPDVDLGPDFSDFRVDTVAICSYSDTGDLYDSVLAHGTVDNLTCRTPPPPVAFISCELSNRVWQVDFESRTNWMYTLERTSDFLGWTTVSGSVSGTGGTMFLQDTNSSSPAAFYRVLAVKP